MLEIADLDGDVDARVPVVVGVGFHVADVGVDIGDLRADSCEQSFSILDFHRQFDRVGTGAAVPLVPLDLDAPLRIVEQVDNVRTCRRVDRYAFAARDVADDLLAANRVAAAGAKHHEIVHAAHLDLFLSRAEDALDGGGQRSLGRLLLETIRRDELREHLLRRQLPVSDQRKKLVDFLCAELGEQLRHSGIIDERLDTQVVAARLLLEHLASKLDGTHAFLAWNEVLDLVARVGGEDEVQPVAARFVPCRRYDLDDVAVLETGAERHHLAVDARADALVSDVGMNGVREVDRRGTTGKGLDEPFRRETVDLLRIQIDLEVLDELQRVAHLLLVLEQLPHPLEVALVPVIADAPLFVLPVSCDALLRHPVHFDRADLNLERDTSLADHRRVQRLIAVRAGHRDEVLDAARDRRPRLVDDAERAVAVLDAVGHHPQGDEVVDLLELDFLTLELLVNAPESLDSPIDLGHWNLGVAQLRFDGRLQALNQAFSGAAPRVDLGA